MTSRGEPRERLGVWFSLCAISRFKIRPRAELHCFGWRKATLSAKASRLGGFTRSRPGRISVAGLGTSTAVGSGRKYRGTGSRSHWRKQKRDSWRVGRLCCVSAGADRPRVRPWAPRDGMKRVCECVHGAELDLQTLVRRREEFPLARLESRLKSPRCGLRRVVLLFERRRGASCWALARLGDKAVMRHHD